MNAAVGLMDGLGLDGDRCIRVIPRQHIGFVFQFGKDLFCVRYRTIFSIKLLISSQSRVFLINLWITS